MARPISKQAEKAQRLLEKNPAISGAELARKTGLNVTSIYKAHWWKKHKQGSNQ